MKSSPWGSCGDASASSVSTTIQMIYWELQNDNKRASNCVFSREKAWKKHVDLIKRVTSRVGWSSGCFHIRRWNGAASTCIYLFNNFKKFDLFLNLQFNVRESFWGLLKGRLPCAGSDKKAHECSRFQEVNQIKWWNKSINRKVTCSLIPFNYREYLPVITLLIRKAAVNLP